MRHELLSAVRDYGTACTAFGAAGVGGGGRDDSRWQRAELACVEAFDGVRQIVDKLAPESNVPWTPTGFVRRWVCNVVRSGYHNGAHCTSSDPHESGWRCGWRYEASLTDDEMRALFNVKEAP